jgi:hypothetical protein
MINRFEWLVRAKKPVAGVLIVMLLPTASLAETPRAQASVREASRTEQVSAEQSQAARRMDERIARHEKAARRAMAGICAGC